jgi:anti-sigma B factor antagonist
MFQIGMGADGEIVFVGRFDAAQCAQAQAFVDSVAEPKVFDFTQLEYISSAGLGVLLKTQKRLMASGGRLRVRNVNAHIHDIFRYSGFDQIFEVERAA